MMNLRVYYFEYNNIKNIFVILQDFNVIKKFELFSIFSNFFIILGIF